MPVLTNNTRLFRGTQEYSAAHRDHEDWPAEAEFSPADLTGLKIWLDAADYYAYSEVTGGPSWPNKATGGVAMGWVSSPPPSVSPATKNGLPLVRFKVNEGRLRVSGGTGVHLEWTLAYVGRTWSGGVYTAGRVVNSIYPTGGNLLVGFWNGFMDVAYDNGFMVPNTQTSLVNDVWKLYSADGSATGPLTRFFSNGTLLGSYTSGNGWGNCLAISGYDPSTTAETCDCEVAEVIQYNRKLTDVERQQVEGYLREKWGFPTP